MFRKRLICIILSIILGITPILQSIPVLATENNAINESISMYIQMMDRQKDSFVKSGSAEYVSGLQIDDCVLIDLEWLSNKLGLLVEIIEPSEQKTSVNQEMSYDIRKYQEVEKEAFSQNQTGKAIRIRKTENNYLQFILKTGSEKAFTYSPHLGEIKVDLGAEVTEQDGKIYVPFTMFLNLFDSHYILDEENIINLYPCETTVVDILHMTGLSDYYFSVIEDSGLKEWQLATVAGYDRFYRKIKALFQGVVNLDIDTLMKAMPSDKTEISELLAKMLLTNSKDELEKVTDLATIDANLGFYTVDFIKSQIEDGAEESLSETIQKWAEKREQNIKSTGFSSIDDSLKFEAQAAKEIASEQSIKANIDNWCNATSIGTGLANIGFSGFIKYITLASEVNEAEIFYVDAVKNYIDKYDILQEPFVEESIISTIGEKTKLYEKKETSILKNTELMKEIFKDIGNTTASIDLSEIANYSAKKIHDVYPNFKVKEFSKGWMQLQGVSIGWDIAEFLVNKGTNGSLEALDALYASLYAMLLQTDSYNVLKSVDSYQDLDEYRKAEWMRLRSYYITRQLIQMFYQPQELLHPEEYKIAMAPIKAECDELVELMAVLAVGSTGLSQEKLNETAEMRGETDTLLLECIKNQQFSISLSETELVSIMESKIGRKLESYVYVDMDHDGACELIGVYCDDEWYYQTWYCSSDGEICELVHKNDSWMEICEIKLLNIGNETHVVINAYMMMGTYNNHSIIALKNKKIVCLVSNEYGDIYITDEGDIVLDIEAYNGYYEANTRTWLIHTYQSTYLFYDGNTYKEYGAVEISEEEYLTYQNAQIIKDKINEELTQSSSATLEYKYFKRKNGIIHIQCNKYYDFGDIAYGYYTIKYVDNILDENISEYTPGQMQTNFSSLEVVYMDNDLDTSILGDLDTIIETIRKCYYEIENELISYTVDTEENIYTRYLNNGIMRKITLYPNELELRDMVEEYYYDNNENLLFVFVHDNSNEFRYYFYNGLIYRYIDNNGSVNDYENGKDPYEVENAGELYSTALREILFCHGYH